MSAQVANRLPIACSCGRSRQLRTFPAVYSRIPGGFHNGRAQRHRYTQDNCCLRRPVQRTSSIVRAQGAEQEFIEDKPFRIEQTSFGSILTPIGIVLLVYGFGAFFRLLPGGDVSSLMLIYGFPILLLGFALSYAQLNPVPCKTTRAAFDIREGQQTDIQKQVREDVTRYRYGDEQHLDEALTRVFNFNRPSGIARRLCPILVGVREEATDGRYTLVMEFETKKDMRLDMWETRKEKFKTFFGPGIDVNIGQTERGVDVALVADGTGAGRGGTQQQDVLPPLVPGAKARTQK